VVECSELQLYFHSDGSVEDWGYYLTATPHYPEKAQSLPRAHWLVSLEFELVQCMSALAAVMVTGLPRKEELEEPLGTWMENALIRYLLSEFSPCFTISTDCGGLWRVADPNCSAGAERLLQTRRSRC
jgi:hypothetical protein